MLPTGDIGDWCAEIRQVWRSLVLQTTVDSHAEFVVDSLRYVQPVQYMVLFSDGIIVKMYATTLNFILFLA